MYYIGNLMIMMCAVNSPPPMILWSKSHGKLCRSEEMLLKDRKLSSISVISLNKGRCVTSTFSVVFWGQCNCVVRIGHLWGWEACSDILLHNFWCITLGISQSWCVKLTHHCQWYCEAKVMEKFGEVKKRY